MAYAKKNTTKHNILNYMFNHGDTSKVELAKELNISLPTVLSNVNELMEKGLVTEKGELESTGGRKAVLIGLQKNYRYALGIDTTANQQQNDVVLAIMKHAFTTVPGILWIVTSIVLFFYRLNKRRYNEIVEELKHGKKV